MPPEIHGAEKGQTTAHEPELPLPWKQVQSAIWLIGLAILFWQGWIWPTATSMPTRPSAT